MVDDRQDGAVWGGCSGESSRERGVRLVGEAVRAVARVAFGAVEVERPIPGLSIPDRDVEPIGGVRGAVLAREVAAGRVRYYAERARGEGRSWDEVAEALGLDRDVAGQWTRAELAYQHLIEGRSLHPEDEQQSSWRPSASWRCGSCGQRVIDRGPFAAAPSDNEAGHASDCARHGAEVAAYRAEWDGES